MLQTLSLGVFNKGSTDFGEYAAMHFRGVKPVKTFDTQADSKCNKVTYLTLVYHIYTSRITE